MKKIIINGPCKLSGKVSIQGAKNAAIRHLLAPLLTNDVFEFHNIPRIGTSETMVEIVRLQDGKIKWLDKNTLRTDTEHVSDSKPIPSEIFFATSGGIVAIPILVSRFGHCTVMNEKTRDDYGGDQIGSRKMAYVIDTFKQLGISCIQKNDTLIFKKVSDKALDFKVPVRSYSVSINAVLISLFNEGISKITEVTTEPEFTDVIELLKKMGADIKQKGDTLFVKGKMKLHGIEYECISDRNDFATWVSAALTTNSEIEIKNVDYKRMKLEQMDGVLQKMNISLHYSQDSCFVPSQLNTIKPAQIRAGRFPDFQTEWQVLFSPLLTQIRGKSSVIELLYPNRMKHWEDLGKMGANYKFIKSKTDPLFPVKEGEQICNAVHVIGPVKLNGIQVKASDVRQGACLLISALAACGQTVITGIEHIERGYENIVKRLQNLGADIEEG